MRPRLSIGLPSVLLRLLPKRRGASGVEYAVLAALIAAAVLGAVFLTGDRIRSLLVASEKTVTDGIAGLPLPDPTPLGGGMDGGPSPAGQGAWSGDGAFVLSPLTSAQTQILVLTNTGSGVLPIGAPGISGPDATAFQIISTDCGAVLLPGESCTVFVEASAAANGAATAILAVAGVPGGASLSRTATGFDPMLAWSGSPTITVSGAPGPEPLPRTGQTTLTLENQGFADATGIAPALSGPDAGAFQIATDCPAILAPTASCTVTLTVVASDNAAFAATLDAGGPASTSTGVAATASGFAPAFAWTGDGTFLLDGSIATPATAQRTFTLANTGTLAGAPDPVAVSGTGFSLVSTSCGPVLEITETCTATVAVSASDNGTLAGDLTSGDAGLPLSATASGFAAAWSWSGGGTFILAMPSANPDTVDQTFTLTNTGTLAGVPAAPSVSGAGTGYAFSLLSTTCGPSLAIGDTCTATVRATYTGNVASATGTLASGTASRALTGSASGFAAAWAFDASPSGIFAIEAPATTSTQTFTLRNIGTLAGPVPTRALAGPNAADYEITGGTCASQTLAPNATCTVQVTFTATDNITGQIATLSAGAAARFLSGSASGFGGRWILVGGISFDSWLWTQNPPTCRSPFAVGGACSPLGIACTPGFSSHGFALIYSCQP